MPYYIKHRCETSLFPGFMSQLVPWRWKICQRLCLSRTLAWRCPIVCARFARTYDPPIAILSSGAATQTFLFPGPPLSSLRRLHDHRPARQGPHRRPARRGGAAPNARSISSGQSPDQSRTSPHRPSLERDASPGTPTDPPGVAGRVLFRPGLFGRRGPVPRAQDYQSSHDRLNGRGRIIPDHEPSAKQWPPGTCSHRNHDRLSLRLWPLAVCDARSISTYPDPNEHGRACPPEAARSVKPFKPHSVVHSTPAPTVRYVQPANRRKRDRPVSCHRLSAIATDPSSSSSSNNHRATCASGGTGRTASQTSCGSHASRESIPRRSAYGSSRNGDSHAERSRGQKRLGIGNHPEGAANNSRTTR